MKKPLKVLIIIFVVAIIAIGAWIANGFLGNPISKAIAKNTANKYVAEHYANRDFVVDNVFYNFKDGYYHAEVVSPSSIDTHFSVSVYLNKVAGDSYEDYVLSGWNTYERIDEQYRNMVEDVFSSENFPLRSDIDFGSIEMYNEEGPTSFDEPDYGVKLSELELDKEYDIKQLAKTTGHIVYYAQDNEVSFAKASESLLIIKDALDKADIPFYAIDFVLEKPRNASGSPSDDDTSIHTANFLYDDIYEEGLSERIEQAHHKLMEYYEQEDAKMKD